jgi:ABC-type transport system involved in multi-copper enzyme maturation permease subunit
VVSLDSQPVYWRECRLQQPSSWFGLLWGLYVAGAVLFSLLAVAECATSGVRRTPWAGPFNGFQTMVGLLILSIVAPAALAEDRARGNLELLLSTPVSSRCLVLSKWCAYYRTALGLAVLPTIVAFAHAVPLHRWVGVPLVFGMVLAHGAAVTSLGIALATWVSRIDRALILSAAASVLVTVAWIPLILFLFGGNDFSLGLASGSPLLGVGVFTTELAHASTADWPIRLRWALFWIIAYCGIAVGLLWATLASFDRCLGRIANSRPSAQ